MPKIKAKINEKAINNIRIIMAEEGLNQISFAKKCFQGKDWISKRLRGETGISEEDARTIIEAFPGYRIEWLLGSGEYPQIKTVEEYEEIKDNEFLIALQERSDLAKTRKDCIKYIIRSLGYKYHVPFAMTDRQKEIVNFPNFDSAAMSEEASELLTNYMDAGYMFEKDNRSIHLNGNDFEKFIEKICDYIDFELSHS